MDLIEAIASAQLVIDAVQNMDISVTNSAKPSELFRKYFSNTRWQVGIGGLLERPLQAFFTTRVGQDQLPAFQYLFDEISLIDATSKSRFVELRALLKRAEKVPMFKEVIAKLWSDYVVLLAALTIKDS